MVDHIEAKRCGGLSVCATIHAYQLRDVDDPLRFHALITDAEIDALTDRPANPQAIVLNRYRRPPSVEAYGLEQHKGPVGWTRPGPLLRSQVVGSRVRTESYQPPPDETPVSRNTGWA